MTGLSNYGFFRGFGNFRKVEVPHHEHGHEPRTRRLTPQFHRPTPDPLTDFLSFILFRYPFYPLASPLLAHASSLQVFPAVGCLFKNSCQKPARSSKLRQSLTLHSNDVGRNPKPI